MKGTQLPGKGPIRLLVKVREFHSRSQRARTQLQKSGAHNIEFDIQAIDARPGAVLAGAVSVQVDLIEPKLLWLLLRGKPIRGGLQTTLRTLFQGG